MSILRLPTSHRDQSQKTPPIPQKKLSLIPQKKQKIKKTKIKRKKKEKKKKKKIIITMKQKKTSKSNLAPPATSTAIYSATQETMTAQHRLHQ